MAFDPLSQFRKVPAVGATAAPTAPEEYVAFATKDKVHRLRIRSHTAPVNAPGYNILLNVVYDEHGTYFMLVYTVLMVLVRGRNLQKMVYAIENGMADVIQEFDADRWEKPKDANAAIIDSIEFKATENGSPARETQH